MKIHKTEYRIFITIYFSEGFRLTFAIFFQKSLFFSWGANNQILFVKGNYIPALLSQLDRWYLPPPDTKNSPLPYHFRLYDLEAEDFFDRLNQ